MQGKDFPGGTSVKNPPASAGDTRHAGSVPGLGKSLGEGAAIHSSILAWRIPWTEEPGGLQSIGLQENQTLNSNTATDRDHASCAFGKYISS